MILRLLFFLLRAAIYIFEIALIIYSLYPLFSKVRGVLYQTLATICEPVLRPIRRLLSRYVPRKWQQVDWSPLVAILACGIATMIINGLSLLFRV